tara:strand:+ start:288 stop:500 length:213 start_codon:yes stop_codon:yes gene_type:complete
MAKKKSKAKKENTDLERIKVLKDKLDEILSRFTAMSENEKNEVAELKEEINQIKNLSQQKEMLSMFKLKK